jgi:hypothetical protein
VVGAEYSVLRGETSTGRSGSAAIRINPTNPACLTGESFQPGGAQEWSENTSGKLLKGCGSWATVDQSFIVQLQPI